MNHMSFGNSNTSAAKDDKKASKVDNVETEALSNDMKETELRYVC